MNDKYLAERLAIIEHKLDVILTGTLKEFPKNCPCCDKEIKYVIATDGAPVRKCGCSTGIKPVDVSNFSTTVK